MIYFLLLLLIFFLSCFKKKGPRNFGLLLFIISISFLSLIIVGIVFIQSFYFALRFIPPVLELLIYVWDEIWEFHIFHLNWRLDELRLRQYLLRRRLLDLRLPLRILREGSSSEESISESSDSDSCFEDNEIEEYNIFDDNQEFDLECLGAEID